MNKSELIYELSKRTNTSKNKSEKFFNELQKLIVEECNKGERIEIRKFGSFYSKHRPSRKCRNPETHRIFYSKPKTILYFSSSNFALCEED